MIITESTGMTTYRAGSNADPSALYRIRGALPLPTYVATGNVGLVSWSDGGAGGTFALSGTNATTAVYTPANRTQVVVITASDGTPVTKSLTVFGTLPIQPQVGFQVELDIETKIKYARDRTRYSREEGAEEISWRLGFDGRETDQKSELMTFWRHHRKINPFYMVDSEGNILNKVFFISSMQTIFTGKNRWGLACAVSGVFEDVQATEAEPFSIDINCGGYPVEGWVQDVHFLDGNAWTWGAITPTIGFGNPAPDEVYRWARYGETVSYIIPNLRPLHIHGIRLHFVADTARTIVPIIQGVPLAPISVAASYVGIRKNHIADSDADGNIHITLTYTSGTNAIISAIQVFET